MPVSFAPGRVNLIGEHVDYHGLPVLPMALGQGIRVEFEPSGDGTITLENAVASFGARSFPLRADLAPGPPGDWGNYAMAAAVTVAREFGATAGIRGRVSSDLPTAAGLSSSSALVVAVAGALLHASEIEVDPITLATELARGEQFVGTAGGGMDQAASVGGRAGMALRIGFDPLTLDPVPFPAAWSVIVGHTGVSAEKSGGAKEAYNVRRAETTEALADAAAALGMQGAPPRRLLAERGWEAVLTALGGMPGRGAAWAQHPVTEDRRVEDALDALNGGRLTEFGGLLDASHESLRDVYQVSHPALDALVLAAREGGAAGARLTGAGFGGCMLAVCEQGREGDVVQALTEAQHRLEGPEGVPPFVARPGDGARIL